MLLYIFNQLRGLHFIHIKILRIWGMASTHLLAPSLIDPTRPRKLPSQLLPLPFNGWLKFLLNWEIGRENFIKSFCCLLFNKAKAFGTTLIFNKIDETWYILACHSLSNKQKSVYDEGVCGWWCFAKPTCHRCLTACQVTHSYAFGQTWPPFHAILDEAKAKNCHGFGKGLHIKLLGSQWQVQKNWWGSPIFLKCDPASDPRPKTGWPRNLPFKQSESLQNQSLNETVSHGLVEVCQENVLVYSRNKWDISWHWNTNQQW